VLTDSRQAGIKVLINLHTTPGGRDSAGINRIFTSQQYQDSFIEVWEAIAQRYKDNTTVWGVGLANEPIEPSGNTSLDNWYALATLAAEKIRTIDPDIAIVVQPAPSALPEAFNNFSPILVSGIIYGAHMNTPTRFTHQGIDGFGDISISYPGLIDNEWWDKDRLSTVLQPVINFQTTHDVPIYIGELSAVRWAPSVSAFNYLKEAIELFEENSWDWAYREFRGEEAWSVELPSGSISTTPSDDPTQREALLKSWFQKNNKPKFFFSLQPDENTTLHFDRDGMLACNLPVLVDDQSNAQTMTYDVIWSLDTTTAVLKPIQANLSTEDCSATTLTNALSSIPIDSSGFTLFYTDNDSSILSNNASLRTCNLLAKYPDNTGGQLEGRFDVDWQFNETDGTWSYVSVTVPTSTCGPDSPIIIIH